MTKRETGQEDAIQATPLARSLATLEGNVHELHMQWRMFRELFAHSERRVELLNDVAPAFWGLLQRNMQDSIYLGISRLTEGATTCGQRNLSLSTLIKDAREGGDGELAMKLSQHLSQLKTRCQSVRWHRNKRLAHNDALAAVKNLYTRPSHQAIEEILGEIRVALNEVRAALGMTYCAYEFIQYRGGGDSVAYWLAQGLRTHSLSLKVTTGKITPEQLVYQLINERHDVDH